MEDVQLYLQRIRQKLQLLLKEYQLLQKQHKQLTLQIQHLQIQKDHQSKTIAELQEKLEILKTVRGNLNEEEKKAFEKRLTHYIKEIDRCITILAE